MPTIVVIDGIKIVMYAADHAPPHFHILHAEHEAMVRISDLTVLSGDLPRPLLRRALEWAADNQGTLALHWVRLNEDWAMTDGFGHRICAAAADAASRTVTLTWDDGTVSVKDMAPLIGSRRLFRRLANPADFETVGVIEGGRGIGWGDDIDICADSLWFDAHPEQNPFVHHATAAE